MNSTKRNKVLQWAPLSPILYSQHLHGVFFEELALEKADKKPSLWLRCVDDTFVTWPHDLELLQPFLHHLNCLRPCIKFTVKIKKDGTLPFLDVLVTYNPESHTIQTTLCRTPTHTDWYIHYQSYHPPSTKTGIIQTLLHWSKTICLDPDSQVSHLISVFQQIAIYFTSGS